MATTSSEARSKLPLILSPEILINSKNGDAKMIRTPHSLDCLQSQETQIQTPKFSRMIKPPTAPKPLSKIKNNVAKEYEAKESSDNRVLRKKNSQENSMMRTVFKSVRKDDSGFKNYDFNTCNKIDTRYDDHNSRSYISNSLIKRPIQFKNQYTRNSQNIVIPINGRKLKQQQQSSDQISILKNHLSQPIIKRKTIRQFDSFISNGSSQENQNIILRDSHESSAFVNQGSINPLDSQQFKEFLYKKRRSSKKSQNDGVYNDMVKAHNKLTKLNRNLSILFASPQYSRESTSQLY